MKRQTLLCFMGLLLWTGIVQGQTTADNHFRNPMEALESCEWKRTTADRFDICRNQRREVIRLFTSSILTALESPEYVWGLPGTAGGTGRMYLKTGTSTWEKFTTSGAD